MLFTQLGLSKPILKAIKDQGYDTPTPIQAKSIPPIIEGRDILAAAQTGTGKTAGFTLPILEKLIKKPKRLNKKQLRVLVLTPTRELAAQVAESVAEYGKYLPYKSSVIFGGVSINPQLNALKKSVDIVIATPGRLLDIANQKGIDFTQVDTLVLDEADRMLDMGFIHDIKRIMKLLPAKRQTLLFSATFSNDIKRLASGLLNNPIIVEVAKENITADQIKQTIYPVDKARKKNLLLHLIKEQKLTQVLVFTRTKHGANKLCKFLDSKGVSSLAIHGNKSQGARTKALAGFKAGQVKVLVATDIAARGIDIEDLPTVVNFELPNISEDYVHRIGRTGRAGQNGQALSLVCIDEHKLLRDIEKFIDAKIPQLQIQEFTPDPDIKAEPIQNGRGGGQRRGGNNQRRSNSNSRSRNSSSNRSR